MKYLAILGVFCAASAANADILLDFRPASTQTTGYSVGDSFFQWRLFQPFTVTNPAGWDLDRISLSGFQSSGVTSGAIVLEIVAAADMNGPAIASAPLTITNTAAGTLSYVGTNIDAQLSAGNYILRIVSGSTSPYTNVGIHYGVNGPVVTGVNASGFSRAQNTPIATYFEGSIVPTPGAAGILAMGGVLASRRRRR